MSFRLKILLAFTGTVVVAVAAVAWAVSVSTRRAFEQMDEQRTTALVEQFRREFARRSEEVAHRVGGIADAEATLRMAIEVSRPQPDYSLYVNDARGLAAAHQLDIVELVAYDGTILSSAHWPARFGYRNSWVTEPADWRARGSFLRREETPDGFALALEAVRYVPVGEKGLFVIGGQWLDRDFLASLVLPAGMRALLYKKLGPEFSAEDLTDASGPVVEAGKLAPLIEEILRSPREQVRTIFWTKEPENAETFHALPLTGREGDLLGVLLVGSSRRDLVVLQAQIRRLALGVGGAGVLLGFLLSWWVAARVSRPVQRLSEVVRQVAAGDWNARVEVRSEDEVGKLARAFNHMTEQLAEQRRKLIQTERVAAWRELARRLAHELKNPLFPLQLTVENLRRAREHNSDQFDEVFRESTAALLAELDNLKNIIARFSDFARMPAPRLQPVNVNELVRDVVRLHSPQFAAVGRPSITPDLYLDEQVRFIEADPDLLRRALDNLVLNAMDAMPAGGTLTLRTRREDGAVSIEVSDTGTGLTREECERLFTPYYTTKQYGTGLGLAIVQSVVSDHGGKIFVESEPGQGTTFRLIFPEKQTGAKQTGGQTQAFAAASD